MGRSAADPRAAGRAGEPDGRRAVFVALAAGAGPVAAGGAGGAGGTGGGGAGVAAGAAFGRSAPLVHRPSAAVPAMKLATPSAVRRASARRASTSRRSWRPPNITATCPIMRALRTSSVSLPSASASWAQPFDSAWPTTSGTVPTISGNRFQAMTANPIGRWTNRSLARSTGSMVRASPWPSPFIIGRSLGPVILVVPSRAPGPAGGDHPGQQHRRRRHDPLPQHGVGRPPPVGRHLPDEHGRLEQARPALHPAGVVDQGADAGDGRLQEGPPRFRRPELADRQVLG